MSSLDLNLRPVSIWLIQPSLIVSLFPSTHSSRLRILNMFFRESHLTITESVVNSADSAVESAAPTTDSTADPVKSACGYG